MSAKDLRFKEIFEGMEQAVYISDPKTYKILYLNKTLRSMFPGDVIGKKCYEIFHDLNEPCSFCTNDKLFGESTISPYIWDFYNKKLEKWFHITDQAIEWEGKKVRFEMAEDITEKKKIEQELKQSKGRMARIFSSLKDTVFVISENFRILFKNDQAHETFGTNLIGKKCYEAIKGREKICDKCPLLTFNRENICQVRLRQDFKTPKSKFISHFDIIATPIENYKGNLAIVEVLRDNTEKYKLNQKIKKSEEKYRDLSKELEIIIDAIPGLVFYKDNKNNLLRVNKYFAEAHNLEKDDLQNNNCFDLYPKQQAQAYLDDDLEVIKGNKPKLNIIEPWKTEKGKKWVSTSKIPYLDEKSNFKGIIGVSLDVTELKRIQKELKNQKEWLNQILISIGDAVIVTDKNSTIKFLNPVAAKLTGWDMEKAEGENIHNVFKIYNEETGELVKNPVDIVLKEGKTKGLANHTILVAKNGKRRNIADSGAPIKDEQGNVIGVVLVFRDITKMYRDQQDLQKSHQGYKQLSEELEIIMDSIPGLVFYKDTENNFINVNKYVAEAHNKSKEDLIGICCFDLYPPEEAEKYWKDDLEVIKSGKPKLNIEERWETEKGVKWLSTSKIPYIDKGEIKGIIGISMDITEKKEYEIKLKEHRDHLDYLVKERIKEITCLYEIIELINEYRSDTHKLLSKAVKIVPNGWQFPEITCARIKVGNDIYKTQNFRKTEWHLSNNLLFDGKSFGNITVCYLEQKPKYDYGPFLEEELDLIKKIANQLAQAISRRRTLRAKEQTQKKFMNTFEQAAVGISHLSPNGKFMKVNQRFCSILGYKTEEYIMSKSFQEIIHKNDLKKYLKYTDQLLNRETHQYSTELRLINESETPIWVNLTVSLVKSEGGEPEYFISVIQDISNKKRMERDIIKNELLYRTIAENLPNGVLHIFDRNFNYVYNAGKKLEELGLSNDILVGKNISDVLNPEIAQKVRKKYTQSLEQKKVVSFEGNFGEKTFMVNCVPLKKDLGKENQLLVLSVDITERKRIKEILRKTVEKLKRSNKELEQFAYLASHDLQEPLRMIASFTQLLQRRYADKLDKDANEFIEFAVDGATRMQDLINDLLIFSRVGTRGKLFKKTDMNNVLKSVIFNLNHSIMENNASITNDPLPNIIADENQMIQILQNLISNAIKFHGKEDPKIHVSVENAENEYIFSVKDNGIGIESEFFEKIFIIFQRLHKKDEYGGTGIGLAVCKKIIQRHKGKIWVKSEKGKGSTLYFSIPKDLKRN